MSFCLICGVSVFHIANVVLVQKLVPLECGHQKIDLLYVHVFWMRTLRISLYIESVLRQIELTIVHSEHLVLIESRNMVLHNHRVDVLEVLVVELPYLAGYVVVEHHAIVRVHDHILVNICILLSHDTNSISYIGGGCQ